MKLWPGMVIIGFSLFTSNVHSQTLRERLRERVKDRIEKRQEEKPAPETNKDTSSKITKAGDYTFSFVHNGLTRMYKLHIPTQYDSARGTPLVLAFHGGGGDMEYQANEKYYKQISKSDSAGFIVAFPNGYSKFNSGKFATWNAGKCCGDARDKNVDDVGFVRELIKKISEQTNIDQSKIYAIGMSNGGMMSYRLACEMPDVFKGIAAVAGTDNTVSCSPTRPISILHIHAKNDNHVLFNGGTGENLMRNKSQVTDFNSVPSTITKWVKLNGCAETPKRVLETKGAYCDLYSGCKNNTHVQLCVTETGAHSWPGGEKVGRGETTSKAISANDVIWDFFKSNELMN